ncbi:MAG: LysM peptidoglycan-binding domain-containing protein [Clostridiales bacterium]|nr:LysM peptidoglycan-binding domain-containing protein [Clostridiales bacterium]
MPLCQSGSYTTYILYKNSEGQTDYTEKKADFEYKKNIAPISDPECEATVILTGCSGTQSGENSADVKAEINVSEVIFKKSQKRIVCFAEPLDKTSENEDGAALTVYFADKGENIWDVAKKYGTTVDGIMSENSLTEKVLSSDKMIMIPKV